MKESEEYITFMRIISNLIDDSEQIIDKYKYLYVNNGKLILNLSCVKDNLYLQKSQLKLDELILRNYEGDLFLWENDLSAIKVLDLTNAKGNINLTYCLLELTKLIINNFEGNLNLSNNNNSNLDLDNIILTDKQNIINDLLM